jgi:hypothetical protein
MRPKFKIGNVILFEGVKWEVTSIGDGAYYLLEQTTDKTAEDIDFISWGHPIDEVDHLAELSPEYKALVDFDNDLGELLK